MGRRTPRTRVCERLSPRTPSPPQSCNRQPNINQHRFIHACIIQSAYHIIRRHILMNQPLRMNHPQRFAHLSHISQRLALRHLQRIPLIQRRSRNVFHRNTPKSIFLKRFFHLHDISRLLTVLQLKRLSHKAFLQLIKIRTWNCRIVRRLNNNPMPLLRFG